MADTEHCSSNPSRPSAPNAFTPEFLEKLRTREDVPLAAVEAETRGPWKVVEVPRADQPAAPGTGGGEPDHERWWVLRTCEDPATDPPSGTFGSREHALLGAAALEVASRGSDLGVGNREDDRGQVVEEWLPDKGAQTVGHFAVWDQEAIAAIRVLGSLLRVPEALARVVEAGGAPIAELLGRRLAGESR